MTAPSNQQLPGLGGADKIIVRQPARIMGGKPHLHPIVMDPKIRMMVLAVGDKGQRVHKRDGPIIIGKMKGPDQCIPFHRPARQKRQPLGDLGVGQPVFSTAPGRAAGMGKV